jgi:hypothetical protein
MQPYSFVSQLGPCSHQLAYIFPVITVVLSPFPAFRQEESSLPVINGLGLESNIQSKRMIFP